MQVSVDGYQYGEVALEIIEPGAQFPPIFPVSYRVAGKVDVESIPTGTEVLMETSLESSLFIIKQLVLECHHLICFS